MLDRTAIAQRAPTQRSRVTNGALFPRGKGNAKGDWARRVVDVYGLFVSDRGGADACSEAVRAILRCAAVQVVECERLEARFSEGDPSPHALDLHTRMSGNLRRLLESVGLERVGKDITEGVSEYLRRNYGEGQQEEVAQ